MHIKHGYGRLGIIGNTLYKEFYEAKIDDALAVVELPTFEGSKRGKVCAEKKGLIKLSMSMGASVSALSILGIPIAFITAAKWKRDIPKSCYRQRVEEIFPHKKDKWDREDEWEAVALALWAEKFWTADGEKYQVHTL